MMVVKAPRKLSSSRTSSASPGVVAALRTQQERRSAASSPTIAAPPPGSPVLAPASPVDAPQPVPSPAAVARFCHEQARRSIVPIPCEAAVFSAAVDVDCLHRDLGRFGPCDPSMTDNYSTTLNVVRARDPDNFALFLASFRASGVYTWSEFIRAWRRYIMCFPEGPALKFVRGDDPCVQRTLVILALRHASQRWLPQIQQPILAVNHNQRCRHRDRPLSRGLHLPDRYPLHAAQDASVSRSETTLPKSSTQD